MAENNMTLVVVGVLILIIITAGLTYYIAKTSNITVNSIINPSTNNSEKPATITVSGEATKTFKSDLLTIGITIGSDGLNTSESQARNVNDTAKVKAALLAAGLDEAEIQTSSYYINPIYNTSYYYCSNYKYYDYTDYVGVDDAIEVGEISSSPVYNEDIYYPYPDKSRCKIIGYKTTHVLLIKTNRTDYGEKIINAALSAVNTTQIDYIYFSLGETARINAESELQTSAAVSARTKAESIANGLGAKLGKIVSVNPDSYYPFYPTYAYNRAADSKDSSVPSQISPTDTTLSNSITVVYELRQS